MLVMRKGSVKANEKRKGTQQQHQVNSPLKWISRRRFLKPFGHYFSCDDTLQRELRASGLVEEKKGLGRKEGRKRKQQRQRVGITKTMGSTAGYLLRTVMSSLIPRAAAAV